MSITDSRGMYDPSMSEGQATTSSSPGSLISTVWRPHHLLARRHAGTGWPGQAAVVKIALAKYQEDESEGENRRPCVEGEWPLPILGRDGFHYKRQERGRVCPTKSRVSEWAAAHKMELVPMDYGHRHEDREATESLVPWGRLREKM